jgi:diacylglycerol kinase family enzyme
MSRRRAAAVGSLTLAVAALVLAIALAVERFPRGLAVLACLWVAVSAGWTALRAAGAVRAMAGAVAVAALLGTGVLLVVEGRFVLDSLVVVAFVVSLLLARAAFRIHLDLPAAPRPGRPVLFFNPVSGSGKATRFRLAEEAERRGIEPIELGRGQDLRRLVEEAVGEGADALAMAGGDGSQAIVADIAAARSLPYACIPAGTRNHFALDLGVDRDDCAGALDAFVDGGERRVDLAEVNGRVFVNNVSLGLYAEAVQREEYRDAKLRTLLEMAPSGLGAQPVEHSLRWRGPDGEVGSGAVALLVSNNVYRLGTVIGSGTRRRLDAGALGIAALIEVPRRGATPAGLGLRQWSAPGFTVEGKDEAPAGIDGEAVTLSPPIRFVSRPGVLRVRVARGHPGASPSTEVPRGFGAAVLRLFEIAVGDRFAGRQVGRQKVELELDSRESELKW